MGCDIHIVVEYYDVVKKEWIAVSFNSETSEFEEIVLAPLPLKDDDETFDAYMDSFKCETIDRDYDLFSRLANVRNDVYPIEPLQMPRGLPVDVSNVVKQMYCNSSDVHTPTYFELNELNIHTLTTEVKTDLYFPSSYVRSLLNDKYMIEKEPDAEVTNRSLVGTSKDVVLTDDNFFKLVGSWSKNTMYYCDSFALWRKWFCVSKRPEPTNLKVRLSCKKVISALQFPHEQILEIVNNVRAQYGNKARLVMWFDN